MHFHGHNLPSGPLKPIISLLFVYLVSHRIRKLDLTSEMISCDVFILMMKEERIGNLKQTFPSHMHFGLDLFTKCEDIPCIAAHLAFLAPGTRCHSPPDLLHHENKIAPQPPHF